MRRWMAVPLLFAVVAVSLSTETPQVLAQGANVPVEETFLTADGVQLHGLFLKSEKTPNTDPVVILLYAPGKGNDMDKGDWKGLAKNLSEKGYNVFRFDWRGHGKSKDIKNTAAFWGLPTPQNPNPNPYTSIYNMRLITGAPTRPGAKIKNDFDLKDLKANAEDRYAPLYLVDLAAVRYHLDGKNDAGDVNMSSIYLIGAEKAAGIGMAWLATEWHRPSFAPKPNELGINPRYDFVPQPLNGGVTTEAAQDISGAIWLTPNRPTSVSESMLKTWVSKTAPRLRDTPMLFLYGDKDSKGKSAANFFFNEVLVAEPKAGAPLQKLDQTFIRDVKNGNELTGVKLLGENAKLGTEDTIVKFMAAIQKERAKLVRKNRGYTNPWFINLIGNAGFGFPMP